MVPDKRRIPRSLPIINLNNIVMFPYLLIPLTVTETKLKRIIEYSLSNEELIGFFLTKDSRKIGRQSECDYHTIGTAATILRMVRNNDDSISLMFQGVSRIKVEQEIQKSPFSIADVHPIAENLEHSPKINALRNVSMELIERLSFETQDTYNEISLSLRNIDQSGRVADIIAGNVLIDMHHKQDILQTVALKERFEKLNKYLAEQIRQVRLENSIRNDIELEMEESQKRFFLREQLAIIKRELGEPEEYDQEIILWKERIEEADLPFYVEDEAFGELDKLATMSPASPEYSTILNYLEWIVNLPWTDYTTDRLDIPKIERILETDHYGLQKVKERVTEYIAVKKLTRKLKIPILCFVGPPGVGKTSFGKSIARSLNRKFTRISLGGIHDEAEIRGHRRTYIGAMPGKIINEIKRCGKANPIFMLDEIDKIGTDFRGDPASALLEVLDPEQNSEFTDNFLNLKFDLSEVIFITTANTLDTIPPALKDRMEVLEFTSYVEDEKVYIAKKYLVPKELANNGLTGNDIRFSESALTEMIRYYVREAGVRNLQRIIASVMRKVAKRKAMGETKRHFATAKNLRCYLGRKKYSVEIASKKPEIGVVTGLAWTPFGGEIMFCEAIKIPGKGNLILTGLLGEIMKESATIAFNYIKGNHDVFEIGPKDLDNMDFHIHLPAGATPKDGPSAGITLTTAIVSLLTEKRIKPDIAMTGELTLKGKILPVGGLKEKLLAAKRAGVKTVILPQDNLDNYEDLDIDIRRGLKTVFVDKYTEVLKHVVDESNETVSTNG